MSELAIAALGIIVGGILSWIISWFFFRKAVNKRFGAYIQFSSAVLSGVDDPTLRSALEIRYNGRKIEDLFQLQFVVANEGERPIRDVIEPLSLTLPAKAKLLDARVIHVEPEGRTVQIKWRENDKGETRIEFPFSLLNKGEFFIVKLLINGQLDTSHLDLRITVDDLPPVIRAKHQAFAAAAEQGPTGMKAVIVGLVPIAVAVSFSLMLAWLSDSQPALFPGGAGFHWFTLSTLALLVCAGGISYWIVRALDLIISRGIFKPKQRFVLPQRPIPERLARRIRYDIATDLEADLEPYLRGDVGSAEYDLAVERHLRRIRRMKTLTDESTDPEAEDQ